MVLSKDNIDVIEEIKTLELTGAQKRRLRRKKLKAARAESLDTDSVHKDLFNLNTHPSKSVTNHKEYVSNKKHRHPCDAQPLNKIQNYFINESIIIDNPKSRCEKQILFNDSKVTSQSGLQKNNNKCAQNTKNQEFKGHTTPLITNQNKLSKLENSVTSIEKIPASEILNLKKEQNKLNGNPPVKPESSCIFKNKKNKSDNSLCSELKTISNVICNEKEAATPQSVFCNEIQSTKLKDLSTINSHTPSLKNNVLIEEQIIDSIKVENINFDNIIFAKQEHKPQKSESLEIQPDSLDKQNMGKTEDSLASQKQKKVVTKAVSNKDDTSTDDASAKSREEIKAAREAKKLAKQKAKKKEDTVDGTVQVKAVVPKIDVQVRQVKENVHTHEVPVNKSVKPKKEESVNDLNYKENIPPTDKLKADDKVKNNVGENSREGVIIETTAAKAEEAGKSKAELKAERRAKQEAQRKAKQESQHMAKQPVEQKSVASDAKDKVPVKSKEEKSPKTKAAEKSKPKTHSVQKVGWFQHLYVEKDKESLNNIPINSNLHPAVVKLGVQLATRVVTGSNARCIALLDAIKKMVRDYSLPARTEFGRGLQAQLAAAAAFLWARRAPAAAENNALKHLRRHLTQMPANVDEFDAKKQLQEEIDRYIREQIDMAGEAISLILRNKISPGDHILTYGCSSLIERVLCSAWAAGVRFRATVAGARGQRGPEMLRRLRARGVPATYVDISALSHVMNDVQKVVLGAGALLAHGAALGAAGSAQAALIARARNVPVLVACETHKFSERTHLDPLVCHEIGDPDELIDKTDPASPLRDWRANPNLTLLNVTYDVTPPSLITAVVTELGILPCTSAPVVLRFKQSEYGI